MVRNGPSRCSDCQLPGSSVVLLCFIQEILDGVPDVRLYLVVGSHVGSVQHQREVIVIRNVGEKDMPSQKP